MRIASYPIRYWNWKAAAMNIAIRSYIFFLVATHHVHASQAGNQGPHQAGYHAALIEAIYVCLTAGFYSALQQGAMRVEPRWFANLIIIAGVPVFAQLLDSLIQHAAGTPNLRTASFGMVAWGLLSAAFHLHLMRNGAMLVGEGERSFGNDLRRLPRLIVTFVASPVTLAIAMLRPRQPAESQAPA